MGAIDPSESLYKNVTRNDLDLAEIYYPILVELARQKRGMTYGALIEEAKRRHPSNAAVQRAIPVSTGRKLEVIRLFTKAQGLPNLNCLVVNGSSHEPGRGFTQHWDPGRTKEQVFAFDWSTVEAGFSGYIETTEKAMTPRSPRKSAEARRIMSEYYRENKAKLPDAVRNKRELIIELLEEGLSPENAFAQALSEAAECTRTG